MRRMIRYDDLFKTSPDSPNPNAGPILAQPEPLGESNETAVLPEEIFLKLLCRERKRTERSRRPFVLMLLEAAGLLKGDDQHGLLEQVIRALSQSTRETDTTGWYRDGVIGVLFTEIGESADGKLVTSALLSKVHKALAGTLSIEQINQVSLSFHVFPESWDQPGPSGPTDETLYPDLQPRNGHVRAARMIKRAMDIAGSLMALVCFAPIMAVVAVLIKLTSKGPVLFCQERLGHQGRRFQFLKFRSMYLACNSAIHEDYVKSMIAGDKGVGQKQGARTPIYKLTTDPRITPLGRFLRRTSIDELPQLFNVLVGDMSLVGPRPPLPYEVKCYDIWHKGRLLRATPGITGLWQVEGRSKVPFDEMVRLDLQYARTWSLWLDIKILCRTPRAVVMADGAY